ncbi:hypothetical protein C8_312 [Cannes 8 virus]|nr:hypothetical protein C8_312 [Cannes 8 virus]
MNKSLGRAVPERKVLRSLCAVCYETFGSREKATRLKCGHFIHIRCLVDGKATCFYFCGEKDRYFYP